MDKDQSERGFDEAEFSRIRVYFFLAMGFTKTACFSEARHQGSLH
jgi:hypothetical protein